MITFQDSDWSSSSLPPTLVEVLSSGETHRLLYARAKAIVGNDTDAEDVLQDAYINIQTRKRPTYGGRDSMMGWLSKVVTNTAINHLRSRGTRMETAQLDTERGYVDLRTGKSSMETEPRLDSLAMEETVRDLGIKVSELPRVYWENLFRRFKHSESYAHLQHPGDKPIGTVCSQVKRGLEWLRKIYAEESLAHA